jgi:hypothetical protein
MSGLAEVGGGVLQRAGIAAPDMPTGQTHPKVRPGIVPVIGAFLAASRAHRLWFYDAYRGL